jgi:hypothetical protein
MSESRANIREVAYLQGQKQMASKIISACMSELDPNQRAALELQETVGALLSLARELDIEVEPDLRPADLVRRIEREVL